MRYALAVSEELDKQLHKLSKKDKTTVKALYKKVTEILEDPYRFKPLRAPLQNKRRVHVMGCFVLIFEVEEERKTVRLLEFEHHDNAYK